MYLPELVPHACTTNELVDSAAARLQPKICNKNQQIEGWKGAWVHVHTARHQIYVGGCLVDLDCILAVCEEPICSSWCADADHFTRGELDRNLRKLLFEVLQFFLLQSLEQLTHAHFATRSCLVFTWYRRGTNGHVNHRTTCALVDLSRPCRYGGSES